MTIASIHKRIGTLLFAILSIPLFSGCLDFGAKKADEYPVFTSFRDIPGVTEEELAAVEALRERYASFTYGMMPGTEAYINADGDMQGYTVLFCDWLTELFGIPFVPAHYSWEGLTQGLAAGEIDFTGELTDNEERRKVYFMTDAIAKRPIKYFRLYGSVPLSEISAERTLRFVFFEGTTTVDDCVLHAVEKFDILYAADYAEVYQLLKTGAADAFVEESGAEAAFDHYGDVVSTFFLPLLFNPISLATQNPELEPVISVVQKALENNAVRHLSTLYHQGLQEYRRHKMLAWLTEEEIAYINNNPVVPFGAEFDNYPISFYNVREKEWQGIAFDVLREVEALTGLQFEIAHDHQTPWARLFQKLEDGEIHMVSELLRIREREERFLWPHNSFFTEYPILISSIDHHDISISEVLSVKVGLTRGTASDALFRRWFPGHRHTVVYDNQQAAFAALMAGEVDMVMNNYSQLLYLTNYLEIPGYKANIIFEDSFPSVFGINKDEVLLCSIIDKALDIIETERKAENWLRKTYDYRVKVAEAQRPWMYTAIGLLAGMLVLLAFSYIRHTQKVRTIARQAATLTAIFDSIPAMLFTKDLDGKYTRCNRLFAEDMQTTPSQILGRIFQDVAVLDTKTVETFAQSDQQVLSEKITVQTEGWYVHADGTHKAKKIIRTPLIQEDNVIGLLGIGLDITDRKLAEEEKGKVYERTRLILDTIPLCCLLINRNHECIACNHAAVKLFEMSSEQELMDNFNKLSAEYTAVGSPEGSPIDMYAVIDKAFEGETFTGEWTLQFTQNKVSVHALTTFERAHYGDDYVVFASVQDVREQKRLEKRIATMIDNLPGMVFQQLYDPPNFTYTFLSKGGATLTGYTAEELIGKPAICLVHPDDVALVEEQAELAGSSGMPFEATYRILTKEGEEKWVWERSRAVEQKQDGTPVLLEGYLADVTARWKLDAAEREQKQALLRIETIMSNLPGMAYQSLYDPPHYTYTFVSGGCKDLFGYTPEELVGIPGKYMAMVHPEDRALLEQKSAETLPFGLPYEHSCRLIMPDGTIKHILEHSRVLETNPDGTPRILEGYCFDITEQRRLEVAEAVSRAQSAALEYAKKLSSSLAEITTSPAISAGVLRESANLIARIGCRALNTTRLGVWSLSKEENALNSVSCYEMSTDTWTLQEDFDLTHRADYTELLQTMRLIVTDNIQDSDIFTDYLNNYGPELCALLDVPIYINGKLAGVVCVEQNCSDMYPAGRKWTVEEQNFAASLADLMALAISSAERREAQDFAEQASRDKSTSLEYANRLSYLLTIITTSPMLSAGALKETADLMARVGCHALNASRVGIWSKRQEENILQSLSCYDMAAKTLIIQEDFDFTHFAQFRQLIETERIIVTDDVRDSLLWADVVDKYNPDMCASLGAPVWSEGELIGTIRVEQDRTDTYPEKREWTIEEQHFVSSLSDMMALAVSSAQRRAARNAAEQASKAKSAFLAVMSHEIRTPMNSIMGFAELAQDKAEEPRIKNYLKKITDNTKWLLNIINDILDISKIESGRMELEQIPFHLQEIISRCQSVILPNTAEKGLELKVYVEPIQGKKLIGDPVKLYQIFMNLLSNAVKFTETGTVSLSASVKESSGTHATFHFEVKDTGIGMPPQHIEKIFDPFTQADSSTTRHYGGTGLGLTITKNFVEMMGARLAVETSPGTGCTFSFDVKFETTDASDDTSRSQFATLTKPLFDGVVLVCEDNPMNQDLISEHLAQVGLQTVLAANGKIALEIVQERQQKGEPPFDLIFMDMFMPVMDGTEAASKITALGTETPIVAMTANVMAGELEKYRRYGMPDCLGKPFTAQELWHILLKHLTPINVSALDERGQNDEELQRKLRVNFVKTHQTKYTEITEAIAAGDHKLAHRLVHTLKGNAGQIGKTKLQKAAEEVEKLLQDEMSVSEYNMNLLKNELAAVLQELAPLLHEPARPDELPALSAEEVSALFDTLAEMLENVNPKCVSLLHELRTIPGTEELADQIENYDFETAAQTLAVLRGRVG